MGECLGGCSKLREEFNLTFTCCTSCHEDFEQYPGDYELEIELRERYFTVCCAAQVAYEEKTVAQ